MDAGCPSTPPAPGVQITDPQRKASGLRDVPLRLPSMKDTTGQNEQDGRLRLGEDGSDDSLDALLPSYTSKQRRTILKGLRILARTALRAHMERRWPGSTTPPDGVDRVEGEQISE